MLARSPGAIGDIVRERRQARGMSQADFAAEIGASRKWVSDLENGHPGAELGRVLTALEALDALVDIKEKPREDAARLAERRGTVAPVSLPSATFSPEVLERVRRITSTYDSLDPSAFAEAMKPALHALEAFTPAVRADDLLARKTAATPEGDEDAQ